MLKTDPSSVAFAEEILVKKMLLKLKKSKYADDKNFLKVVNNLLLNTDTIFEPDSVNRSDYVEKYIVLMHHFSYFMQMLET